MPRLHHVNVVVPVGKTDAAVEFYGGLLGMRRIPKDPAAGSPLGAWLDVGDGRQVHVSERDGDVHPDSHFAVEVDDFDEVLARLALAGIPWTAQSIVRGARRGFARDPGGNRVEVIDGRGASE